MGSDHRYLPGEGHREGAAHRLLATAGPEPPSWTCVWCPFGADLERGVRLVHAHSASRRLSAAYHLARAPLGRALRGGGSALLGQISPPRADRPSSADVRPCRQLAFALAGRNQMVRTNVNHLRDLVRLQSNDLLFGAEGRSRTAGNGKTTLRNGIGLR